MSASGEYRPLGLKRALSRQKRVLGDDGGLKSRPSTASSTHNKSPLEEKPRMDKAQPVRQDSPEKSRLESVDSRHESDSMKATPKMPEQNVEKVNEREPAQFKGRRFYRSQSASPPQVRSSPREPATAESVTIGHEWGRTEIQAQTIDKLEAELRQKEQEINNLQQQLKEADEDLQSLKIEKQYHISDDYLRQEWGALRYKIQTHTNQRFVAKPSVRPSDLIGGLTDKVAEFMKNSVTRRKLFEAVVWRFLVKNIFSLDGLIWAGSAHEHLKMLSHVFIESVSADVLSREDYNTWRAKSAVMLSHSFHHSCLGGLEYGHIRMDDLILELEDQLRPYQNPGYDIDAHPHTGEIIKDAIEIDIRMRRSRAEYLVFMYHPVEAHDFSRVSEVDTYGFEFNDNLMEREDGGRTIGTSNPRVHLVVSPIVLKKGTAEGDRYDQQIVISKRGVLCK